MYRHPEAYEKAFSYRNLKKEALFIDRILEKRKAKSILDIGCGAGSHMTLLSEMGYSVEGIDSSAQMANHCKSKGLDACKRDMRKFSLNRKFDACISMLATFSYLLETKDIASHLDSVAKVLKRKGAYIIEMGNPFAWYEVEKRTLLNEWEAGDISARMIQYPPDPIAQRVRWTLEIKEGRKKMRQENVFRIIFPEEFKTIVALHGKFEVEGLFGGFSSSRFSEDSGRMIAVLSRK